MLYNRITGYQASDCKLSTPIAGVCLKANVQASMETGQEELRACLLADLRTLSLDAKKPDSLTGQLTGWISGPEHPLVRDACEKTVNRLQSEAWLDVLRDPEVCWTHFGCHSCFSQPGLQVCWKGSHTIEKTCIGVHRFDPRCMPFASLPASIDTTMQTRKPGLALKTVMLAKACSEAD